MSCERSVENDHDGKFLAWSRYLFWCDLHRRRIDRYDDKTEDGRSDPEKKWHSFALLAQWYASLWVVVEGWRTLSESDLIIDDLLTTCPRFCDLLKRFRHGIYHYQPNLFDARFIDLLRESHVTYIWAYLLHGEFLRFLWHWIHRFPYEEVQEELRETVVGIIGWLPDDLLQEKVRESSVLCDRTLRMLANSEDRDTRAAIELREACEHAVFVSHECQAELAKWHEGLLSFVRSQGARKE